MMLAAEILSKRGLKVLKWPADSQVTMDFDGDVYEIRGLGQFIRLPLWHAYLRWGYRKLRFTKGDVDLVCRLAIGGRQVDELKHGCREERLANMLEKRDQGGKQW